MCSVCGEPIRDLAHARSEFDPFIGIKDSEEAPGTRGRLGHVREQTRTRAGAALSQDLLVDEPEGGHVREPIGDRLYRDQRIWDELDGGPDPAAPAETLRESAAQFILPYWGPQAAGIVELFAPSLIDDPQAVALAARMERTAASPATVQRIFENLLTRRQQ